MATSIRRVEYFHTTLPDRPGEAYKLLQALADQQVGLLAFQAVPVGPTHTQLTLFPEDGALLRAAAERSGMTVEGPHPALLVQGDDEVGALVGIHEKLYEAGVNVYAASAVTCGEGRFGYLVWVRPEEFDRAAAALEV